MVYSFFRNKLGQIYLGWEMSARRSKENVFWGSVLWEIMV